MRLSANHDSPYFTADSLTARVLLDGTEISCVVEASEEEGWADVILTDAAGHGIAAPGADRVEIRRRFGVVQIRTEARA